jgi:hypothetical protein
MPKRKRVVLAKKEAIDKYIAPSMEEAQDILFHQGHTWVRLLRAVVEVGLDDFTQRFVGDITRLKLPNWRKVEKRQKGLDHPFRRSQPHATGAGDRGGDRGQ